MRDVTANRPSPPARPRTEARPWRGLRNAGVAILGLGLAMLGPWGSPVPVQGQGPVPPILLVVNDAAPNPFGPYLAEVLRTEGVHSFATQSLSGLTASTLSSARLVVLAETPLTAPQAALLSDYVAAGGRLVAMRPAASIAPLFGLTPVGTSTTDGYLAINQALPSGLGLEATTLPVKGDTSHYDKAPAVETVATLYSDRTTPTAFPAVTRLNRTAAWAFDLARAVAYARQGLPANIDIDSGVPPYAHYDLFYTGFDAQRIAIPFADIEMRLFSRMITDLLADQLPLPRTWYYPSAKRALVLVTGDSHTSDVNSYTALLDDAESFGARVSLYLSRWLSYPTSAAAAAWRATGHEVSMHPFAHEDGRSLAQGFQFAWDYFAQVGWGTPGRTVRTHQLEWQGWADAASIAASHGIGLDLNGYTFGPAVQQPDGSQGRGYISASGLPMRFVTLAGTVIPTYGQTTVLIDHQLFGMWIWGDTLTTQQALAVSYDLLDKSVADYHTVIPTQFHLDYYTWGEVRPWATGTMARAQQNGMPMWTAERWLDYTQARAATTLSAVEWVAGASALQFTATVPAGAEPQTVMVPTSYNGSPVVSVQVNGTPAIVTTQTINGRDVAMFAVAPMAGGAPVVVSYGAVVPSLSVGAVTVTEGTGGTNSAVFTVSLSAESTQTVTVEARTVPGTATSPEDFTAVDTTLTFDPGVTTRTISVPIVTDAIDEPDETFTLVLSNPVNATVANGSATATILNDDGPTVGLSIADATAPEGNAGTSQVTLAVTLSAASAQDVTVNYATFPGTATGGADYASTAGSLTFPAGTTAVSLPITIIGDTLDEPDETFTVVLSSPANAFIADGTAVVTIVDDDPPPSLSVNDVSVVEGTGGTTTLTFAVALSGASGRPVTVNYATVNGTATAPADYTAATGTLTFTPGTVTMAIPISIVPDAASEPTETFSVQLSAPANATIGKGTGVGTIVDDDAAANTITRQVVSGADDVNERSSSLIATGSTVWLGNETPNSNYAAFRFTNVQVPPGAVITAARLEVNSASTQWLSVAFEFGIEASLNSQPFSATSLPSQRPLLAPRVSHLSDAQWLAGTWYALNDVSALVKALVDQPGWTSGNAMSLIVRGTGQAWSRKFVRAFEGDPTFAPRLVVSYVPSGLPTLSINDVSVQEGTGTTVSAGFTVTLSAPSASQVTVNYQTSPGTATSPADYTATSGTLTFAPGTTTATIQVPIASDSLPEPNETFSVVLSAPTNALLAKATGVGTILDDDQPAAALSIADVAVAEGNQASAAVTLTVTLSPASTDTVTVNWATVDGTALAGLDYSASSGTLTFTPGATSQALTVPILGDLLDEADETFSVVLSSPTNATIANGTATVTIVDDDPTPTLAIDDVTVVEGTGGTTSAVFTVTLSAASGRLVSVNYATSNGTATAPADYTAATGTLSFASGATTSQVIIPVVTDATPEPTETFNVTLSSPVNATLARSVGVGTIVDDDAGSGPITVTLQIGSGADDVNDSNKFTPNGSSVWLGNEQPNTSYTGLRFTNVGLPAGAIVTSARLEVNAFSTQWIAMAFQYGVDAAANSAAFSDTSRPSARTLLAPRVNHLSDQQWVAGTWYTLDEIGPIVQAAVAQPGWVPGNAMSVILQGTGQAWARKFARAYEDDPARAVRLVVTYAVP